MELTSNTVIYGASGLAAGYVVGWLAKKTISILFKFAMVIMVLFVVALMYLEHIGTIRINERALDNLLNHTYTTLNPELIINPIDNIATSLGLPLTSGIVVGAIAGWIKG